MFLESFVVKNTRENQDRSHYLNCSRNLMSPWKNN
jgi:hypothetical protein